MGDTCNLDLLRGFCRRRADITDVVCCRIGIRTLREHPHSAASRHYIDRYSVIEFLVLSIRATRIIEPPSVRLINSRNTTSAPDPTTSPTATVPQPAPVAPVPLFSTLSLSTDPVLPSSAATTTPIFGHTTPLTSSLLDALNHAPSGPAAAGEEMDWDPIYPPGTMKMDARVVLRPQRFFPAEKPTGLEGLFAKTRIDDEDIAHGGEKAGPAEGRGGAWGGDAWRGALLVGIGVVGCLLALWAVRK